MIYLKAFLQGLGIAIICLMIFNMRRKSNLQANELAVASWLESMDVVACGQRWQGRRSRSVLVLESKRRGFSNYAFSVLCVTKSGRWFILNVETSATLLNRWEIEPVSSRKAAKLVEMSEDELTEFFGTLDWQDDAKDEVRERSRPAKEKQPNNSSENADPS